MSFPSQSEIWQDKSHKLEDDRNDLQSSEATATQKSGSDMLGKVDEAMRTTLRRFLESLMAVSNRGDPDFMKMIRAERTLALHSIGGREFRMEDLKGMGEACAVVSVFVASVGVGLLSYTHDIFSDRPEGTSPPTSDSAITCLFFISVIFAIVAAMEFTILQITVTRASRSTRSFPSEVGARDQMTGHKDKEARPIDNDREATSNGKEKDIETGNRERIVDADAGSTKSTRSIELWDNDMLRTMASLSMSLLFFSWLTLLAGIFTFIWSTEDKAVKIAITVMFGALCPLPIFHIYTFNATI
ncbi:hypothetical protein SCHPADRAFT_61031 [Schizopora paradoxa]|uniref:Uncharacterized protein n=1 Tax=Schizopora paradoxa TaxID=27342 RepID=A0A0H2S5F5_9AGAM|nr:hypothetical protein SCHPADRAFT_61031 [Schizopora paradoxa]